MHSGCLKKGKNIKKVHKIVLINCDLKMHQIAEDVKISLGSVHTIHIGLNGWHVLSQSTKNKNASTTQSVVCRCIRCTQYNIHSLLIHWLTGLNCTNQALNCMINFFENSISTNLMKKSGKTTWINNCYNFFVVFKIERKQSRFSSF